LRPVLTNDEMRAADQAAIGAGTSAYELMDRAAFACATSALRMMGGGYGRRVLVVAGKGSNGGDGIAAAGHLARAGVSVTTLLLDEPAGDSAAHLERAQAVASARFESYTAEVMEASRRADLVVDAIFGTGLRGKPSGKHADAIARLGSAGAPILAVDIPSGVSGDGSGDGPAVRADVTVAIGSLKVGHLTGLGADHCGRIEVWDIGIPTPQTRMAVPEAADVVSLLPGRPLVTDKYRAGAVAVIGGAPGMAGAPLLAAKAAAAAGAGIVFLGLPSSAADAVTAVGLESVKVPLPDVQGRLDEKSVEVMAERVRRVQAVLAIGPGLGRGPAAVAVVRRALDEPCPLVIDADGIVALAELLREDPDVLASRSSPTVLTPHGGEFARLVGSELAVGAAERLPAVRDAAARFGCVIHLKGWRALTATPDGRVIVNPTGGPALASAGTGDVLTGVVASLIAQGLEPSDACWTGAYLHGAAGLMAAERDGSGGVAASAVADAIPRAIARLRRTPPAVTAPAFTLDLP
jgi:NAD(P)H-hydrate epimerase